MIKLSFLPYFMLEPGDQIAYGDRWMPLGVPCAFPTALELLANTKPVLTCSGKCGVLKPGWPYRYFRNTEKAQPVEPRKPTMNKYHSEAVPLP